MFSRVLLEIQSCGNPKWGFWLCFIECQHEPLREKPHAVNYGSSVNWGWLKGSLILPAQLQKWVMAPEDEKPRGINLDLVQLNTMLVFLSTWGQEMTSLNFLAWQRAEFGEGGADGSTEPPLLCKHVSERPLLSHSVYVGSVSGKADRIPEVQSWGSSESTHQSYFLGAMKMRSGRATGRATLTFFSGKQRILVYLSGKCGSGRGLFSKPTRGLFFNKI